MPRAALLTVLVGLASLSAMPRADGVQLGYTIYVLAVPVADAVLNVELAAAGYRVALRFHTTGVASLFANSRLEERGTGRFEGERPVPMEYHSEALLRGEERVMGLTWHNGVPAITAITPLNDEVREEVPAALRLNTIDPLSALILLLRRISQTGGCEGGAQAFNGRRLQLFEARTVAEEEIPPSIRSNFSGHGLRCEFSERTIAGFRLGSARADDARERGTIWLAQIWPGSPRLPVRVAFETRWFGDAMIYLTAARP